MLIFLFLFSLLSSIAESEGAGLIGVKNIAEQYIDLTLVAFPKEAKKIKAAAEELSRPSDYPSDYTPGDDEEFDFIVVGSGSAGSVVVNRLTEVENWKVLLIEAGGDPIKSMEVPAFVFTYQQTDLDWAYKTNPDGESCLGTPGKTCRWPRGKVLGGTSSFHALVYDRGNKRAFDQWEAEGCTGWGYENVLKYFKKSEDMRSPEVLAYSPEYHSTGGLLKVEEYQSYASEKYYDVFKRGMQEVGYNSSPDANGKTQTGYNRMQGTLVDGRRCGGAKCFLSPINSRKNLKVTKNSLATKILFDKNKKAYGVEFKKEGVKKTVKVAKEIIVCAGTINSPQLLMLSGIGPKKHLESLNISVVSDRPVGENLQDQPGSTSFVFTANYSDIPLSNEQAMYNFLMKKTSPLSHIPSIAHLGFIPLTGNPDWPDAQLVTFTFPKNSSAILTDNFFAITGFTTDITQNIVELNNDSFLGIVSGVHMKPNGRGKIELKSTNPEDQPLITSGYFSNSTDIEIRLKLLDFIEKFFNTESLKSVDAKLVEVKVPACEKMYTYKSRDYRICVLRHLSVTTFRIIGTCKMGASEDPSAVVDPSLRVKGVSGLRVIDASIMPRQNSGNTNAVAVMIGEKGADLVKAAWPES